MNNSPTPTPEREFPQRRLQQRKAQLLAQIEAEHQGDRSELRRRRRPIAAVGAVAAAAVVVATVMALLPAGSGGPSPAAAAALNKLARLVEAQSLTPGPGQYLYIESESDYAAFLNGGCETHTVSHLDFWIGADGSGLQRSTNGPEKFASAADQTACLNANPNFTLKGGGTSNDWYAPRCLSLRPANVDWSSLSTDPGTLLQQLRQLDGGPPTPGEDFVHIGDFLRNTGAPAEVRATLYRAAALIPGVELLGTVRDHAGRPGLGIAFSGEGSGSELIFDPETGELSGEQATGSGGYWAVYLRNEVVNSLPAPPQPLGPACNPPGSGYGHDFAGGSVMNGAPVTKP